MFYLYCVIKKDLVLSVYARISYCSDACCPELLRGIEEKISAKRVTIGIIVTLCGFMAMAILQMILFIENLGNAWAQLILFSICK